MVNSVPPHFDYAKAEGFQSLAAAIIFAMLYVPLFFWFLRQSFFRPTYVHYILTLFCIIRIAAFTIRAVLVDLPSAAENLNVLIADEILLGVGFFGLLYSAYTLVLDLDLIAENAYSRNPGPILRLTRNRRVFRLALIAGVAIGITSSTMLNSNPTSANSLHKVSTVIFLVLTVLQVFQTLVLVQKDIREKGFKPNGNDSIGKQYGMIILLVIAMLLLLREVYLTATINNAIKQNNEHLWYPLLALPEIICVVLYSAPGLVPRRDEIPVAV